MDCIPYINDLLLEVKILKDVRADKNCDSEEINKKIKEKEELIKNCKENLSKLSKASIEYRLYLKILDGLSPSEAVKKIADENYFNDIKPSAPSNIWKYYKKIQNLIKTGVK